MAEDLSLFDPVHPHSLILAPVNSDAGSFVTVLVQLCNGGSLYFLEEWGNIDAKFVQAKTTPHKPLTFWVRGVVSRRGVDGKWIGYNARVLTIEIRQLARERLQFAISNDTDIPSTTRFCKWLVMELKRLYPEAQEAGTLFNTEEQRGQPATTAQAGPGGDGLPIPEGKTDTPKHELLRCNQWLIEEHLEKGRDTKTLVDEWLRIRREKDYKDPPLNPLKNMRTAISEERKRRRNQE